jgi:Spy/CpxP family protein refolding chaperone
MTPSFRQVALAGLALLAMGAYAFAQSPPAQPYAGMQDRPIKVFSEEQIADLKAGRGMGLALAAELNGYPGPVHVLDLGDQLGLSEQQRASIKELFEAMKAEAVPLGQRLLAAEKTLNEQFAARSITAERLKAAMAEIAQIQGELRNTHLKYHLSTAALLTQQQIGRYAELRGYIGDGATAGQLNGGAAHGAMHHMHPPQSR